MKCNVLESFRNHHQPSLWKNCLPRNLSVVPKKLETATLKELHYSFTISSKSTGEKKFSMLRFPLASLEIPENRPYILSVIL